MESVADPTWTTEKLGGVTANVMPSDGSVDLPKLLKHYQALVTELWTDLDLLKQDMTTIKAATGSFAFEDAGLMVRTGFEKFVIAIVEDPKTTN